MLYYLLLKQYSLIGLKESNINIIMADEVLLEIPKRKRNSLNMIFRRKNKVLDDKSILQRLIFFIQLANNHLCHPGIFRKSPRILVVKTLLSISKNDSNI